MKDYVRLLGFRGLGILLQKECSGTRAPGARLRLNRGQERCYLGRRFFFFPPPGCAVKTWVM